MCGLLSIFRPGSDAHEDADRLLGMLGHRGPEAHGLWCSDDGRLALGHTRLKIIDLSDTANQPMHSADGRWVLIFNGEIVNYRAIRAAHKGDWRFQTNGDSEVLLATFAARGPQAMHDWVGMFAFVLYDRRENRLYFARDRFGIKPLYWTRLPDGGIAAASEIPPLLRLLPSVRADRATVRTYLETGLYDTGARTFFEGVHSLRPGAIAELDLSTGVWRERFWYRLAEHVEDLSGADEADLVARGGELVQTAIRDHLVSDVPVGLNVSGGVDSSVLVAVAGESIENLHVFSQDYAPPYSEAAWVKKVAGGANLHLCKLDSGDIEQVLDRTVRLQAEPFGGLFVAGYEYIYREADREGVTVLLDGNGVDEVFLGYTKFNRSNGSNGNGFDPRGHSIDGTSSVRPDAIATPLRRDADILPFPDTGRDFPDPVRAAAALDMLATKIPRSLRFNDRTSMGQSKELRVPFLDHRLVEFGFGVPRQYLLAGSTTKALFRKIARRWISEDVAQAQKRSVQLPQREWLAGPWRGFVSDILASRSFAEREWVDPQAARLAYERYCTQNGDNSFFIWQWVNLELWARAYLD